MEKTTTPLRISVGTIHYRELSEAIRERIDGGVRRFRLENVIGQRYIGAGLGHGIEIEIWGVPGQDLGVFNGGCTIIVHGNAQDGVGNTMNDGLIVVHGSVGDIPGHMIRNGKIYIRGSAGFRAGIMMKEYGTKHPVMIVGETIGDYVGEYMAGGTIIALGYGLGKDASPVTRHVASGMFGGKLFIRGPVSDSQLGIGAVMEEAASEDLDGIMDNLREYAGIFGLDMDFLLSAPFTVIRRVGGRPYGNLYVPSSKVSRGLLPVHRNSTPPCAAACPVGIPNPVIIRKLKEGEIGDAFDLLDDYTPFRYACCGMVCPGLCRAACTRGLLDEPVRINEIAKMYHPEGSVKRVEGDKEETVAVIGAGPAGLSAAWHLARRGYGIEVFERESDIGGKLVHSIPDERLPREDVEKDLARIRSLGIGFNTGKDVDEAAFRNIRKNHSAVVIAVGSQKPRAIGFKGEENAVSSFEFLRSVKTHGRYEGVENSDIVVAGAGNVGMDAASECFRLGARSVTVVDIQKPAANERELEHALNAGVRVLYPRRIERYEEGRVGLHNGESLSADLLIVSIGEIPVLDFAGEDILADPESYGTNLAGVYIAGDARAPGLVAHSIGAGKDAALQVHRDLRHIPLKGEAAVQPFDRRKVNLVYFCERDGVYGALDDCISCGTCIQCDICVENCPRGAVERIGENFRIDEDLCTGCGVCASVCPRGAIIMEEKSEKGELSE